MDEQILQDGDWAARRHEQAILLVHLCHPSGAYQWGVTVRSRHQALWFITEHGLEVSRAFATYKDEVVLDVVGGVLAFPKEAAPLLAAYREKFPPGTSVVRR